MFEELYDSLSGLMSWTWPTVEGEVTASNVRHVFSGEGTTFGLEIAYKFLVGEGGPYVGLFTWAGTSDKRRATAAQQALQVGNPVLVRFRPDDPSVNKLDRSVWHGL